jgi:hypothetical protein
MSLKIHALHGAGEKGKLNEEWIVIANEGDAPFNAEGCSISVGKGTQRPRTVITFQAGLVIKGKETCRLVTGSSGKKSHGEPPDDASVRTAHLFLKAHYLERAGLTVRLMNRQLEICRATYDPEAPNGIAPVMN